MQLYPILIRSREKLLSADLRILVFLLRECVGALLEDHHGHNPKKDYADLAKK